jgi:hypothetical protein
MRDVLKNMASLPEVEIAETPDDLKVIAERTLTSREKVIYYVGSVEVLMQGYERTYDQGFYIPTRTELGIFVKMLVPDTEVMRAYQANDAGEARETRALPDDVRMDYSAMIHDDHVVFFLREPKLYGLSIISPALAQTMKAMFHDMWRNAKK